MFRMISEMATRLVCAGLIVLALGPGGDPPNPPETEPGLNPPAPAGGDLHALDDMIGQMLVVGFNGQASSDGWTRKLIGQIHSGKIGGVILMDRNLGSRAEVQSLIAALAAAAPSLPLLVAVDQEGGAVERLGPKQGVTPLPAAANMARQVTAEAAGLRYASLAAELKSLGFNLNLGPVVDLSRNPESRIITRLGRSFGSDPATVAAFARAFIRGHRLAGVLTAAKHFPGHGSSAGDTHTQLVDLTASWSQAELEPYRSLNHTEPPQIVMVGHLYLERFDAQRKVPASLSRDAIEAMLRRQTGFAGAVMTDDLDMGAIRRNYTLEDAAVLAVAAGSDLILVSNATEPDPNLPERLLSRIRSAVRDGTIPRRRIEEAFARIRRLKETLRHPHAAASRSASNGSAGRRLVRPEAFQQE
jgi:beta-N-acetylhexosaminidase